MTDILYKTVAFPKAVVGAAYEAAIGYTGNTTLSASTTVSTGALPNGLVVNADKVRITGTPTKTGTFSFKLTMTDTGGAVESGSYSITVTANPHDAGETFGNAAAATLVARAWPLNVD